MKPRLIVALSATGARSVFGRPMTIGKSRGREWITPDGTPAFVTIHPSMLLRIKEAADKEREYRAFVDDLRRAVGALRDRKPAA